MSRTGHGYHITLVGLVDSLEHVIKSLSRSMLPIKIVSFTPFNWFDLTTTLLHDENQNKFRGDPLYDLFIVYSQGPAPTWRPNLLGRVINRNDIFQ